MDSAYKFLDALVEKVADRVVERILPRLAAAEDTYTSHRLPPDVRSKNRFHRVVRDVAGARRDGRVWIVPRGAWEAYRTRRRTESHEAARSAPASVDIDADDMLAAAGLRPSLRAIAGGAR